MVEADSRRSFGPADAELAATVTVNDPSFWRAVARRGSRGLGESYADGAWDCDDLVALVRIAAREVPRLDRWQRSARAAAERHCPPHAAQHARARARAGRGPLRPRERAVRAVPRRDDDLLLRGVRHAGDVACARRRRRSSTWSAASSSSSRTTTSLEIGTGWGSLALHAAGEYGCRVTTTTLSREQHAVATERVREARSGRSRPGGARGLPRPARALLRSSRRSR